MDNGRMDGWMNRSISRYMNEQTKIQNRQRQMINGCIDRWRIRTVDGWMDIIRQKTDRWINTYKNGGTDVQINERVNQ